MDASLQIFYTDDSIVVANRLQHLIARDIDTVRVELFDMITCSPSQLLLTIGTSAVLSCSVLLMSPVMLMELRSLHGRSLIEAIRSQGQSLVAVLSFHQDGQVLINKLLGYQPDYYLEPKNGDWDESLEDLKLFLQKNIDKWMEQNSKKKVMIFYSSKDKKLAKQMAKVLASDVNNSVAECHDVMSKFSKFYDKSGACPPGKADVTAVVVTPSHLAYLRNATMDDWKYITSRTKQSVAVILYQVDKTEVNALLEMKLFRYPFVYFYIQLEDKKKDFHYCISELLSLLKCKEPEIKPELYDISGKDDYVNISYKTQSLSKSKSLSMQNLSATFQSLSLTPFTHSSATIPSKTVLTPEESSSLTNKVNKCNSSSNEDRPLKSSLPKSLLHNPWVQKYRSMYNLHNVSENLLLTTPQSPSPQNFQQLNAAQDQTEVTKFDVNMGGSLKRVRFVDTSVHLSKAHSVLNLNLSDEPIYEDVDDLMQRDYIKSYGTHLIADKSEEQFEMLPISFLKKDKQDSKSEEKKLSTNNVIPIPLTNGKSPMAADFKSNIVYQNKSSPLSGESTATLLQQTSNPKKFSLFKMFSRKVKS